MSVKPHPAMAPDFVEQSSITKMCSHSAGASASDSMVMQNSIIFGHFHVFFNVVVCRDGRSLMVWPMPIQTDSMSGTSLKILCGPHNHLSQEVQTQPQPPLSRVTLGRLVKAL
jgi:hypothetical protein